MAGGQRHELVALAGEKWIVADQQRAGTQLDEGGEGGLDFALGCR